jgi:putative peptide zinc metalloprotease protein
LQEQDAEAVSVDHSHVAAMPHEIGNRGAAPKRAPNVRLLGALPHTAFKEQQWLIQRDPQFVQVTELLYRILEAANGDSSIEQIAQHITESSEWLATPDAVRSLIANRLAPCGLIGTEGLPAKSSATSLADARSPLAVHARMKIISPRYIERFTAVLQNLFAPPLLIPLLVASGVAHLWAYGRNDVLASVTTTL